MELLLLGIPLIRKAYQEVGKHGIFKVISFEILHRWTRLFSSSNFDSAALGAAV